MTAAGTVNPAKMTILDAKMFATTINAAYIPMMYSTPYFRAITDVPETSAKVTMIHRITSMI